MTDIEFMRAAELKHMDRVGVFILGLLMGFCLGIVSLTLTLVAQ